MKKLFLCLWWYGLLGLIMLSAQTETSVSTTQTAVSPKELAFSAKSSGEFAWKAIVINPEKKDTSMEEFFDAYVNDLADVAKPGYKALPPDAQKRNSAAYAQYYKQQGKLQHTINPFDIAIKGEGFLPVRDADGQLLYTRNGAFTPNTDGNLENTDGHILEPPLCIADIDADAEYRIDASGVFLCKNAQGQEEEIYQFHLFMPEENTEVSRCGTAFVFQSVAEVPIDTQHKVLNKTLELSTTQAEKTLVGMTQTLYKLRQKNPNQNYDLKLYLTDFLFKEYVQAADSPQALERFAKLVNNVAGQLTFTGSQTDEQDESPEPIMIR